MNMGKLTRNKTYNGLRHHKLPATRPRRGRPPTRRGIIDLDSIPTRNSSLQEQQFSLPEELFPSMQQDRPTPNNVLSGNCEPGSSTTTTSTIITIKMTTITHTDASNHSSTTTTVTTDISPVSSNTISSDPASLMVETRELSPHVDRYPPIDADGVINNNDDDTEIVVHTANTTNTPNTADMANTADTSNTTDTADMANTTDTTDTADTADTTETTDTVNTVNTVNTVDIDIINTVDTVITDNTDNSVNTVNTVNTEMSVPIEPIIQQDHLPHYDEPLIDSRISSGTSNLGFSDLLESSNISNNNNAINMVRTPSTATINSIGTSSSPVLDSSFVDSNTVGSDTSCLMNRSSHSPMSNSPTLPSSAISRPSYYRLPELDTLGTVYDVWNEWNVGLGENPSIIALLETYGTKWANENKETLLLRKKLIKEIQQRSNVIGVDSAINELERMRDV
ncbi:8536_t:CDS:2 [Funneliformis geosporum]|nr:8536_t:CDS:2 [Funneliformis geosporum]